MSDQHLSDPAPRSGSEERTYLLRRAEDHRRLAETTDEPGSRTIHLRFQQLYIEHADSIGVVLPDQ